MWISTLENTFDTDQFANFAIMPGKVSIAIPIKRGLKEGKQTFSVDGFYALRDGSVIVYRGKDNEKVA